jgi:hypothetical protein
MLGGYIVAFKKFLQCFKYIILEFTPPSFSFIPFYPIPGIVSMGAIFLYIHVYTVFAP